MKQALRNGGIALVATLTVAGCGAAQAVKNSTVEAAKWAFTTQVKTMNLDLVSRSSLNTNSAGESLSTVVRIYQLKTPQAFEQLSYVQLQTNDLESLKADLLASNDVVLRPAASVSLAEPIREDCEYVGVAALFRDVGNNAVWKLVIPKKQWKKTDPVKIEARGNVLERIGVPSGALKSQASQLGATSDT
ncbi:type VI secretion system lipoprotein TssJ [Cupriavidus metallidurans]|uniref:type VI secretion system lipoprotein TssJ n=1 Tax=Cupriavidus TaxID=106589 RepID=UPI000E806D0C|nr:MULTISPECIES: type VI secretion system lipoprotein TssJ [unclassified Cupriavidus]HBD39407.1 type VI secretion system lipoprotein TssJ [Cupriavidus sp.]